MPNTAPAKVSISPNETSTEPWISPMGDTTKPAMSSPEPRATRATAHTSCARARPRFSSFSIAFFAQK